MAQLSHILGQRTDLSTFVVHLTRSGQDQSARENLIEMLEEGTIEARNPYGSAVGPLRKEIENGNASQEDLDSQNVVCFTETPLEHMSLLLRDIDDLDREMEYAPYGIGMTKKVARRNEVNPVWYVDITPGHDWLINPVNRLIDQAIESGNFRNSDIADVTPFIEQMGTGEDYRKEFWWEREWRHSGNFWLPNHFIIIAPEEDHTEIDALVEELVGINGECVDPRWGLESIIARLAGYSDDDVGAF
ncbi:abortive infection system antitoxin AbiGi family protein [Salinibacter ruber]|uniref:abortive infection system antitoxin AbiGi family protein n=1 Tax=Salinibacter ruber TaxID=146919 RepID=UPI000E58D0A8|nr:abortive infection system antitoxin AbiGi family protein [Salinibacter ruber]